MAGLKVTTKPSQEPVSIDDIKEHLRIDGTSDDAILYAYTVAARTHAEEYTGRTLIQTGYQMFLDSVVSAGGGYYWEGLKTGSEIATSNNHIEIAASPVIEVSSIKYYNEAGAEFTWAPSNYHVDTVSDVARIALRDGGTFPTDLRTVNGFEVNFTAGYGRSPYDVPEPIKMAIKMHVAYLYEHRGDFERYPSPELPKPLRVLLNPYKIMRFGASPFSTIMRSGIS